MGVAVPAGVDAGTDVAINSDSPGTVQNEVRIAQDQNSPMNFVAAYNDLVGSGSSPLGIIDTFISKGLVLLKKREPRVFDERAYPVAAVSGLA